MASILERTINTDDIENRKVYLQLFFVQRCTDFSNWWRRLLNMGRRRARFPRRVPART